MRFQIWGLLSKHTDGIPSSSFEKIAEGVTLGALLGAFREVLTNATASRLYLIDTTANTVTRL